MNFINKEKRKKYKSQTSKITKKSLLKNNNNNDNKNLKLPNLKGVLNNFSRNKNNIYNHKNTLSYSSNISKNLISMENKTFFGKINHRTKSFNNSNLML